MGAKQKLEKKNNVVFCTYLKNWKIKTFSQINLALKYYPNQL